MPGFGPLEILAILAGAWLVKRVLRKIKQNKYAPNLGDIALSCLFSGAAMNSLAKFFNGGKMPVACSGEEWCLRAVFESPRHILMDAGTNLFLLGDIIPIGFFGIISAGDILMAFALLLFLLWFLYSMSRSLCTEG